MLNSKNSTWVGVSLGHDCNSFIGVPYESDQVIQKFKEIVGADQVTRIRKTMDDEGAFQAFCRKDGKDLGFFCIYCLDIEE